MTTASQAVARIREAMEAWESATNGWDEACALRFLQMQCTPDALRAILDDRDALAKRIKEAESAAQSLIDYLSSHQTRNIDTDKAAVTKARAALAAAPGGEGAKT